MPAKPSFRAGQPLKASDLRALADMITRRAFGGNGLKARVFGDQIVIEGKTDIWRTRRGGTGGGAATIDVVQAVGNGSAGVVSCKVMTLKADVSASPNYTLADTAANLNYFKA